MTYFEDMLKEDIKEYTKQLQSYRKMLGRHSNRSKYSIEQLYQYIEYMLVLIQEREFMLKNQKKNM
jgi:hypothetical protein